jgi:phosphatidylglycerol:prolipoprotein diacylglycerol transferase
MLMYPKLNPVALSFGKIKVYWYGIMYMLSFLWFLLGAKWRIKKYGNQFLTSKLIDDLLFNCALGVVIGGRLGYCLFYQPAYFFSHPLSIVKTWEGGMSFHGGMLGVFFAVYLFTRKYKQPFYMVSDFIAIFIPLCLLFGRLGNFINSELPGRFATSNIPWAMVYPRSGSMLPRHPSSLYEILGEGIILGLVLWIYAGRPRKLGQISGLFLMGYGVIRFIIEYFRAPDVFLADLVEKTGLSMGQWLCIPMIVGGAIMFYYASKSKVKCQI